MRRVLLGGIVLAFLAAIAMWIGQKFGVGMGQTVFGISIGAALALIPGHSVGSKIGGFLIGAILTLVAFGIQALFFPLTDTGFAIGAFLAMILVTIAATLSHKYIKFYSFLLGVAALGGAYGTQFLASPQNLQTQGIAALGSVLFVSAIGFLGATLADLLPASELRDNEDEVTSKSKTTPEGNAGADILTSTKG